VAPGAHALLTMAQAQLAHRRDACRPEVEGPSNPARELARRIGRTIPLFYGGGSLGGVAAYRWKCDVNENAKAPAYWNVYPELGHNEICAWGQQHLLGAPERRRSRADRRDLGAEVAPRARVVSQLAQVFTSKRKTSGRE
jgi:hypothetical protein